MCYRNHLESVYCIAGEGDIEDTATGQRHEIRPGVIYALDQHDAHVLHARTEMTMACVFNPPLNGREVHDDTGAYPLEAERV
jgi:L-ectoine synthase